MGGIATKHQMNEYNQPIIGSTQKIQLNGREYSVQIMNARESGSEGFEVLVHFQRDSTRPDTWISSRLLEPSTTMEEDMQNFKFNNDESKNKVQMLRTPEEPINIKSIIFGRYEIGTWYSSQYPEEYGRNLDRMYICEHCLKYMMEESTLRVHKANCRMRSPPGDIVYQQGDIKIFRIDGKTEKLYSQNLCLMSKLFLDHKSVYYDIEGFMFYVLTERNPRERRTDDVVAYFSKEKISYENNNLACIMVLPPHQRKGYGKLMIEFSYELARHENQIGTPEKPLSDLGHRGYRSYWASVILRSLIQSDNRNEMTVEQLSQSTYIHPDDILDAMQYAGLIKYVRKSKDNATADAVIYISRPMIEEAIKLTHANLQELIDPAKINWNP